MRRAMIGLFICIVAAGADRKPPFDETSNELVDLTASAIIGRELVQQELGADPGTDLVVVRVKLRPVSDKAVNVDYADFVLFSDKDGQRSQPYEPGQIAGSSTLALKPPANDKDGEAKKSKKTRLGGSMAGISSGSSPGTIIEDRSKLDAKIEETDQKDTSLLGVLKQKALAERAITEPETGLLYFQIDGKVKAKDLQLNYKTPAGKLSLRFR